MPHSNRPRGGLTATLCLAVLCAAPSAAPAADAPTSSNANPWSRAVAKRYTAQRLGLAQNASPRRLARAAVRASARSLGLRSRERIRYDAEFVPPANPAGSRDLRTLRFRQTAGGLRVLWSEIDVAVSGRAVTSISATTVPVSEPRLRGRRRVSPRRAQAIAKRAIRGRERALRAQPVAYAGTPGKPSAPRRAWVVQLEPVKPEAGADAPEAICVVVDAASGKVLMRYKGFLPQGGGTRHARSAVSKPVASIFDAGGGTGSGKEVARWTGDLRQGLVAIEPLTGYPTASTAAQVTATTMSSVLRDACLKRDFCAGDSVIGGALVPPTKIVADSGDPSGSHYRHETGTIVLEPKHADDRDVMAHEFGHLRDLTWADERLTSGNMEAPEVQEALADMFAFDFDQDPNMAEDVAVNFTGDALTAGHRNLKEPGIRTRDGIPYPATMSEYRCDPTTDEHINATILGHAYYLFVRDVGRRLAPAKISPAQMKRGHEVAGDVLTYIPWALPVVPTFSQTAYWFQQRAYERYGPLARDAALASFVGAIGLNTQVRHGKGCDPKLPPKPPPDPRVCERQNPPPSCFGQSPPIRPEIDPT